SDYINPFTGGSNETIANYAAGHPGSYIKVGGYYYSLKSENAACSDTSPASAQELAFNTFQRFIKNIQPISQ
ncbi:MAG TPA: hypothetical protein VFJ84_02770, partial [Candidatus Saccharimonadales bacterium]|nr:hypothetical protein [Candidatus Saccharimonadales bacterium]